VDKSSLIGLLIGTICLGYVAWHGSHGHLEMFYSEEGCFTVIGGSISVVFMALPLDKVMSLPAYLKKFLLHKGKSPAEVIKIINTFSEKARRDGILALEAEIAKIDDKFLSSGLKMAVDGVDPSAIESTLRMEVLAMQDRHKAGKKLFDLIKVYGPAWGLVGTLIGQIGMFGQLGSGDVGAMGKMLALAVVATMYGTVVANALAGPIGDKLALRSAEEILTKEMMLQGILSIQAGDNPRVTFDRMLAFVPPVGRAKLQAVAA
jgi:chemotaxis protein MotA